MCAGALLLLSWLASPASARIPSAGRSEYIRATRLLTTGRDFNQAITLLQSAVRAAPNNSDYHLALGCADADETESGIHALKREVKDDKGHVSSSERQTVMRLISLDLGADREWKAAVVLAADRASRANDEYVRGVGLFLLADNYTSAKGTRYPTTDESVAALRSAVKDAPKNPYYWEALGAALYDIDFRSKEGLADMRRSLALKPRKSPLWYILFDAKGWRAFRELDTADLFQAERSDPNNALPCYLFAYAYAERTPLVQDGMNSSDMPSILQAHPGFTREQCRLYIDRRMAKSLTVQDGRMIHAAVAALEKGNRMPSFVVPIYEPPIPAMLQPAWTYSDRGGHIDLMAEIRELARTMSGVVDVSAIEGHYALADEEANDIVTMGGKIADFGNRTASKDHGISVVYRMLGVDFQSIGYTSEAAIATERSDPAALRLAHAKLDQSMQQGHRLLEELNSLP